MDVRLLESRPSRMLWAVAKRVDTLTPRERQVLALVVRGVSNTNFAAVLGVREKSIEVNRSRAVKKNGSEKRVRTGAAGQDDVSSFGRSHAGHSNVR